jgi:hypothetical protein
MRAKWLAIPVVAIVLLAVSMMISATGATPKINSDPAVRPPSTTLSSGTHLPRLHHAFGL